MTGSAVGAEVLRGRRVLVTRAPHQARALADLLESIGAEPVLCPVIGSRPPSDFSSLDDALADLERVRWIAYTSVNAVASVYQRAETIGATRRLTSWRGLVAAVGRSPAANIERHGSRVDFVPSQHSGPALASELPIEQGEVVLMPRSDLATADAPAILRARGAEVLDVVSYRTVRAMQSSVMSIFDRRLDAITFTSGSTVDALAEVMGSNERWSSMMTSPLRPVIVCLGPRTARAVHERGWVSDAVAPAPTLEGLVDALAHAFITRELQ